MSPGKADQSGLNSGHLLQSSLSPPCLRVSVVGLSFFPAVSASWLETAVCGVVTGIETMGGDSPRRHGGTEENGHGGSTTANLPAARPSPPFSRVGKVEGEELAQES